MKFENLSVQGCLSLVVTVLLSAAPLSAVSAAPVIGVANSKGAFKINQSTVTGNGTVLDGATVETSKTASIVRLSESGTRVQLGTESRGKVFKDRLVLERGTGRLSGANYRIQTAMLHVVPETPDADGQIQLKSANVVLVAALKGSFRVTTINGATIAAVTAGRALDFETQAGAAGPATLTGCVSKRDGRYFLTDETAGIRVELQGPGIEKHVGHRVEVTGSTIPSAKPAGGADHVVAVSQTKELSNRCSSPVGAVAGAGAGKAGAGAGMSAGAKAVIAGVLIAATSTGTVIAVTGDEETGSVSR